jgi:hypothetical protein
MHCEITLPSTQCCVTCLCVLLQGSALRVRYAGCIVDSVHGAKLAWVWLLLHLHLFVCTRRDVTSAGSSSRLAGCMCFANHSTFPAAWVAGNNLLVYTCFCWPAVWSHTY